MDLAEAGEATGGPALRVLAGLFLGLGSDRAVPELTSTGRR
jgi:hypothetical protein